MPLLPVGVVCGERDGGGRRRGDLGVPQPSLPALPAASAPRPWAPSAPAPRTLPIHNFHNSVPSLRGGTVPLGRAPAGLSRHPAGGARVGPARRRIKLNKSRGCSRADSSDAAERHPQPPRSPACHCHCAVGPRLGVPRSRKAGKPHPGRGRVWYHCSCSGCSERCWGPCAGGDTHPVPQGSSPCVTMFRS